MVTTGGNLSEERFPPDLFPKTSISIWQGQLYFYSIAKGRHFQFFERMSVPAK